MKVSEPLIDRNVIYRYSAENPSNSTQYGGIDLIKFFCAFLVVIIHISPFPEQYDIIYHILRNVVARIAVPFYFAASGFLLFYKIDMNNLNTERVHNYCFRILRLLGMWTVLLVVGGTVQLWYLGALVVAIVFLSWLIKNRVSFGAICGISLFLYTLGLLGDSYHGLVEQLSNIRAIQAIDYHYFEIFNTTRNGLLMGLAFVLIGVFFTYKKVRLKPLALVLLGMVSIGTLFLEYLFVYQNSLPRNRGCDMYISLLPITFVLLYLAINIRLRPRKIYYSLRVIGMLVFYIHMIVNYFVVNYFLPMFFKISGISITHKTLVFIIVVGITVGISIIIERLSSMKRFKFLRCLYT